MMETGISLMEIYRLPFSSNDVGIHEARGAQRVELRRRNNADSKSGIYRCDIPTVAVHHETDISCSERDSLCWTVCHWR